MMRYALNVYAEDEMIARTEPKKMKTKWTSINKRETSKTVCSKSSLISCTYHHLYEVES